MGSSVFRSVKKHVLLLAMLVLSGTLLASFAYSDSDDDYITKKGFPKSYRTLLKKLHKKHPKWRFTPAKTGLDWGEAVDKMTSSSGINTIWASYPDSYKSVVKGRYNYLKDTYKSGTFVAASKNAVKYYMDPRNFLNEKGIFIFEDKSYSKYHTKKIVSKVAKSNRVLKANAEAFVTAGKKYDISPVYLATKSVSEIGTSTDMMDGHGFRYGGVKYSKCYNAYNIGSSDSGGKLAGLVYANGGRAKKNYSSGEETSYGRKWDSPSKAIKGGAKYIRKTFMDEGQHTAYLEHFNVMNGYDKVGTHIYMSLVAGPLTMGSEISSKYKSSGIYDSAVEFSIPVYENMPSKPKKAPPSSRKKNNNNYLKSLTVKVFRENGKTKSYRPIKPSRLNYVKTFEINAPEDAERLLIEAEPAAEKGAKVSGTGKVKISRKKTVRLTCKASSGAKREYVVKVYKD